MLNNLDFFVYFLLKFFSIGLLLVYLFFSLVLVRQTKVMLRVLEAKIAPFIYTLSLIHFFFNLFTLIWAIFFL